MRYSLILVLLIPLFGLSQTNTNIEDPVFSNVSEKIQLDSHLLSFQIRSLEEFKESKKNLLASNMKSDTIGEFQFFWYDEKTSYSPSLVFYLNKDGSYTQFEIDYQFIEAKLVNLDSIGKKELIIYSTACEYGSGGGQCDGYFSVINTDSTPYYLMNERYYSIIEGFSRSYGNDDERTPYVLEETERKISITENTILVGAIQEHDNEPPKEYDREVSNIPSGKYSMKDGVLILISEEK
jgi:hypothetical protein